MHTRVKKPEVELRIVLDDTLVKSKLRLSWCMCSDEFRKEIKNKNTTVT